MQHQGPTPPEFKAVRLHFGPFVLDVAAGELRRSGEPIPLAPKPFEILAMLVVNAGRLVTRQELHARIWSGAHLQVDESLNFSVRQLRRALGDDAKAPRFIQTVPRRGYRFIAPVANERPGRSRTRRLGWRSVTAAAVVIAVVSALVGLVTASPSAKPPLRVVVLPFTSGPGDASRYVAAGISTDVDAAVAGIAPQLISLVPGASSGEASAVIDFGTASRHGNADFVVRGSVESVDSSVTVTLQLYDAARDAVTWEDQLVYCMPRIGDFAPDFAALMATRLGLEQFSAAVRTNQPANVRSREAFWRAEYLRSQNDRRAIDLYRAAIAADSGFPMAHVRLAEMLLFRSTGDSALTALGSWAAQRAVELEPDAADAHRALGDWYLMREWDGDRARLHYERSLSLHPNLAKTHHRYALLWVVVGDTRRALAHLARARALDPLSTVIHADLGWTYVGVRRFDRAADTCRDVVRLDAENLPGWSCLLVAFEHLEDWPNAHTAALELSRLHGARAELMAELRALDGARAVGRFHRWRYETATTQSTGPGSSRMHLAFLAAEARDAAAVKRALTQAIGDRDPLLLAASSDPRFDAYRDAPWFQDVLRSLPALHD